jgi:hypothetical protein
MRAEVPPTHRPRGRRRVEQAQRACEPAASVTRVVDLDLGRWCALAEANGRAILKEGFTMVSTITRSESLRLSIARL